MRGDVDTFSYFYTDGSRELKDAISEIGVPHDHSDPGILKTTHAPSGVTDTS